MVLYSNRADEQRREIALPDLDRAGVRICSTGAAGSGRKGQPIDMTNSSTVLQPRSTVDGLSSASGGVAVGKRRSPQEKKRLSYSKDRRNWYGENDKSSRKNIARNKRKFHRSERHRAQQELSAALGPVDEGIEAALDERLTRARRGSRWRKFPDAQLGLYVAGRLTKRAKKGISTPRAEQARIERVQRRTDVSGQELRQKWW